MYHKLQGLEKIPKLQEEIQERDVRIADLEKELSERSLLLVAARKAALEYKDKLRVGQGHKSRSK